MRGGEANAVDAFDRRHVAYQQGQVRTAAVVHKPPIGVHVLAQQGHLPHPLLRQLGHLRNRVVEGPAELLAAGEGNDAIGAVLGAALHNRDEGRGALCPGLG